MPVKLSINKGWDTKIESGMQKALAEMSVDVQRRAVINAPVETGALKNSGRVEPITNGYAVKFGSSRVPYARKRHFENRKNPQTLGYLAKAGDSVMRGDKAKYFRYKI